MSVNHLDQTPEKVDGVQNLRQVHTITDRFSMGNTYVIDDGHLVIIDPGTVFNVRQIEMYLTTFLHRTMSQIDLIVLTHLHPDHTAGVHELKKICTAPVAASSVVQQLAQAEQTEHKKRIARPRSLSGQLRLPGTLHYLDLFLPVYERQKQLVDLWLDDGDPLPEHPNWHVLASPGHTPDSLCLYNRSSKELLCGDTVITIQGGAPLLQGGSNRRQLDETLRKLRELQIHYLYPGHGRPILSLRPLHSVEVEW